MKKVLIGIFLLLAILLGLRFLVLQLAVDDGAPPAPLANEPASAHSLPSDIPSRKVVEKPNATQLGPSPLVELEPASDHDPELVDASLPGEVSKREATHAQSPEALFPELALMLSQSEHNYSADKHQQALAKFVQSVDPSVHEIEQSLQAMEVMQLSVEKQQAYTAMANDKIAALLVLKEKAMRLDPNLMSIHVRE